MIRFQLETSSEKPGAYILTGEEGINKWTFVESNYKMIMDWLKSNLGFKEARIEEMKRNMDQVAIHEARSTYITKLIEEARVSASGKEDIYFNIIDDDLYCIRKIEQ